MASILFVCTGNVFRSVTAEYALKAALGPGSILSISSAGTLAPTSLGGTIAPYVVARLREYLREQGFDQAKHQQRRVTPEILSGVNLVVAMGLDHQAYLLEHFGRQSRLFNEICFGLNTSILDIEDVAPNDPAGQIAHGMATVDYICEANPRFVENIQLQNFK